MSTHAEHELPESSKGARPASLWAEMRQMVQSAWTPQEVEEIWGVLVTRHVQVLQHLVEHDADPVRRVRLSDPTQLSEQI
jgi:hypothetical protein